MSKASQSDSKDIDILHVSEKVGDNRPYQLAVDSVSPATLEESNPDDGGPIYAMYVKRAEEEDKRTAEGWKEEAEKVFLFTGLFSAVVASFISMSIQDIQANPLDTSNFYLASIHQALASSGSNLSSISLASPPPFTPPTFGVWVNSLWTLSLVISMTCAVLANLLQQWARKYLKVTQPRSTASKPRQARYRAYYAEGVETFYLPWVFEALPAMLHLSVFLFFAGLVVFLWNFVPTISKLILTWVAGCVILYGYITFIPTYYHDSPYNTPLSPLAWNIVTGVPYVTLRISEWVFYFLNITLDIVSFIRWFLVIILCPIICCFSCCFDLNFLFVDFGIDLNRLADAGDRYRKLFYQGMRKTAEKAAFGLKSGLSKRALMWTFDTSHEDSELETFFSSLPGIQKSNDDEVFLDGLTGDQKENLWGGLVGFLDRTYTSDSLSDDDKNRRAKICADAFRVDTQALSHILDSVISEDQCAPVQSAELVDFIGQLGKGKDVEADTLTEAIVSSVVATAKRHNPKWFTIASTKLGVGETVLRSYTAHDQHDGPDLSLAILIHFTCKQLQNFKEPHWPSDKFSKVLRAASKFKVQQASPRLQHGFCSLWNLLVEKAQDDEEGEGRKIERYILRPIYKVYVDIHQRSTPSTNSQFLARTKARTTEVADILRKPREYHQCAIDAHHLDMSSLILDDKNDTSLITFAAIIELPELPEPTSGTTPAVTSETNAAGAPSATPPATEPGPAVEDDVNRAHLPDPRSSSVPSITDSKGAEAGHLHEPDVKRIGGDVTPPVSHHGDNMV